MHFFVLFSLDMIISNGVSTLCQIQTILRFHYECIVLLGFVHHLMCDPFPVSCRNFVFWYKERTLQKLMEIGFRFDTIS